MIRPSFPWIFFEHAADWPPGGSLPTQIWHLSGQLAQKSCRKKGKHFGLVTSITVQAAGSSAKMRFRRQPFGWLPPLHGSRD